MWWYVTQISTLSFGNSHNPIQRNKYSVYVTFLLLSFILEMYVLQNAKIDLHTHCVGLAMQPGNPCGHGKIKSNAEFLAALDWNFKSPQNTTELPSSVLLKAQCNIRPQDFYHKQDYA